LQLVLAEIEKKNHPTSFVPNCRKIPLSAKKHRVKQADIVKFPEKRGIPTQC
jgi:hypothetical protein